MASINYNHLRYFWAVAHNGNLTRTARNLNLSQSALSVQIKSLEGQLGHALFERTGRQMHLTEAGRIALDHADTIFAAGQDLLGTLGQTGKARQILRIGALATLSRNFQLEFLRPVLRLPDVEVILRSGGKADLLNALETLSLDIVLVNQAPLKDALKPFIAHRIAEQSVSLIGMRGRCASEATLPQLLQSEPIILPTKDSSIRTSFDALIHQLGVSPHIAAEVDDMAMMRLLAREGAGLAVLPAIVVQDELSAGILVEVANLPSITETFFAVVLERRFPNPLLGLVLKSVVP
jgi:LysR family transcriptional regulator, transcriptional activator of nhaA